MSSLRDWINTGLLTVQTGAVLFGVWFAYNEFGSKQKSADAKSRERIIEYANQLDQVDARFSGDLEVQILRLHFPFADLPQPTNEAISIAAEQFSKKLNGKEKTYFNVMKCLDTKRCDEDAFARFICPHVNRDILLISILSYNDISYHVSYSTDHLIQLANTKICEDANWGKRGTSGEPSDTEGYSDFGGYIDPVYDVFKKQSTQKRSN